MSQFTVRLPTKITTTRAATAEVVEANMIQDVKFQGQFIEIRLGQPIETSISEDPQPHPQSLRFFEVEDRNFRNFEVF